MQQRVQLLTNTHTTNVNSSRSLCLTPQNIVGRQCTFKGMGALHATPSRARSLAPPSPQAARYEVDLAKAGAKVQRQQPADEDVVEYAEVRRCGGADGRAAAAPVLMTGLWCAAALRGTPIPFAAVPGTKLALAGSCALARGFSWSSCPPSPPSPSGTFYRGWDWWYPPPRFRVPGLAVPDRKVLDR